jgi:hypothetical protein
MTRSTVLFRRLLAVVTAVLLGVTLLPAAPAAAAGSRVKPNFFGMHDFEPTSWPVAPVGAIRLWDSGVSWRQIETSPGVFDFTRLDAQVDAARANGARVLLVLGQTPRFHSTKPRQNATYGKGAGAMPKTWAFKRYVAKVVARYRGRGVDYQVWNEANVAGYWRGTPKQMAVLTKVASKVVRNNDRSAKVVAPALATRLTSQRKWLRQFYAQRTGGKRVASYVNVISLNLYPLPKQSPEASMSLLAASRTMLRALGVRKPIWNTEINYGLLGGGTANNISRSKEAAYVARTFVLNADADVKRVFWYGWDVQQLANTQLTNADGTTTTRAGKAYAVTRGWLLRTRSQGCDRDRRGTYTCTFAYSGGKKRIYWNPSRKVTVRAVGSATKWVNLRGTVRRIGGGVAIGVGKQPVMVRSRR